MEYDDDWNRGPGGWAGLSYYPRVKGPAARGEAGWFVLESKQDVRLMNREI